MAGWSVPGVVHLRQVREDPVGRRVVARHRITRKPFAITYLSPEFLADAEFRARFASECAQLTQVRQAEVARVYRYLDGDDGAAVIGEHLNGTTLRSLLLAQGAIGTEAALVVLKGLLRALSACHQAGLAHGDVTPDDVILTPAGRVRLTGFGLWTADGRQQLSRYTPYYLAPEQWSGPAVSRASGDVYAATVTFFECLVGAPPFYAHDAVQLSAKHRASLVPVEVIPEAVRELVVAGLAKDPGSRPDASSLLAAAGEVATREAGRDWERRGRRELAAHLAPRSALMDVATLSRRIRGAGRMGYRPVRLAAVMGGALALAAGLSSPPLAVIPGINIFGPGGRPPVLAFPEPDRGPVAMRVVTNGRPADRAQTPAAKVSTAGPVVGTRPSASSMEEATARADHAHLEALPQRAAQPQGVIADSTSARFTRACTGHLGDGSNPCTAQQVQPTPGSAGSPSDPSEVSIPVALPVPLLSDIQPVQLPLPVQLPVPVQQPAPVQDVRPSSVPDEAGARKDFHTAKDFSSHMDSQVPRKMTVRAKRADTDSARFGPPRTLSQNGFGSERGFGGSSGAGRMGNR